MSDDGILVNFSLGDGPLATQAKLKGGSWRDRLSAKRADRPRKTARRLQVFSENQHEDLVRPNSNVESSKPSQIEQVLNKSDFVSDRPSKRVRLSNGSLQLPTKPQGNKSSVSAKDAPKQVVSSLFSFNPKPKPEIDVVEEDSRDADPSNAPLVDGIDTFTSLGLSSIIAEHLLRKLDVQSPTAIQRAAIQQLIPTDSDAFIQAETGSGKTLAYLLPIVHKLVSLSQVPSGETTQKIHRHSGLFAIVLAPTRELSKQISTVLESLLRCAPWIVSGTVIGGEKKKSEKARLRKGVNILIATPGRLADHIDHTEVLDVSPVRWLVLDEGDRLMELGFEEDIRKLVSKLDFRMARKLSTIEGLPQRRSTILCSATMKSDVQQLGDISLKNALYVKAEVDEENDKAGKSEEQLFSAPAQLKQAYAIVPAKLRLTTLVSVLKRSFVRQGAVMKVIVFLSCADSVDFHFELFAREDKSTDSHRTQALVTTFVKGNKIDLFKLHGSLQQSIRTSTLAAFKKCTNSSVLICTDVASRGLDLPNVDYVIEYDPPFSKDDHLHRVGRTARAGKDGRALIFLLPGSEEDYVSILKSARHNGIGDIVRHDAEELLRKCFTSTGLQKNPDWEENTTEWQLEAERWVMENPKYLEMARRAFQSHVRAYATHVASERGMFDMSRLHLGHLAKAFALRDKPGDMRVPGMRPSVEKSKRRFDLMASGGSEGKSGGSRGNAKMMQKKIREQLSGASEFNVG